MRWAYLGIVLSMLLAFGGDSVTLVSARRRRREALASDSKRFEGIYEIGSQAAFTARLLLMAATNFGTLEGETAPAELILLVSALAILLLVLGILLGRLLMRFQLLRVGAVLNTITGEVRDHGSG